MKAMVFAAGFGQRLRPVTDAVPKALVPLRGRPMIEYPLRLLGHYGIREITINVHHLGHRIEEVLGSGEDLDLDIRYSREEELLDTGGGLLRARPFLKDETFIVINSDVLIDLRIDELIAHHFRNKATATLVLRRDAMADDYGPIETTADGRVRRFLDHYLPSPSPGPLSKFMFTGVQVMEPRVFDYMEGDGPFGLAKVSYPRMLVHGEPLYGFAFEGFWQDLGTPERIREAEDRLARGEAKLHFLESGK